MPTAGKLGKLPPREDIPNRMLRLSTLLRPEAMAAVPQQFDYTERVTGGYPMYRNDALGICGPAAVGHILQALSTYGQGTTVTPPQSAINQTYYDVGHYVEGEPSTDNGVVLEDLLKYWRKTGVNGNKIVAYAFVDPKNHDEVAAAIYYFGHIMYGFNVPQYAMDEFNAGQSWHIEANGDATIIGGHAVTGGAYDLGAKTKKSITWATVQPVDDAFYDQFADESYVVVDQEWINNVTMHTPAGLDMAGWGSVFTDLTGQPSPFPDAPPTPIPTPTPTPPPDGPSGPTGPPPPDPDGPSGPSGPPDDDLDEKLASALHDMLRNPLHWMPHHDVMVCREWLTARNK